jgi:hypothetical protein
MKPTATIPSHISRHPADAEALGRLAQFDSPAPPRRAARRRRLPRAARPAPAPLA